MLVKDREVVTLTDHERALLDKLADAGQPTELRAEKLLLGRLLERKGLVLFDRNSAFAVILPKGRHTLAREEEPKPTKTKPQLGFLD